MTRDLGHSHVEATLLEHIGDSHATLGEVEGPREAWRRSLRLYQAQHRTSAVYRLRQRGCRRRA